MRYTDFKHDGKQVSRFGLGCMRFPTIELANGKKVIDEEETIRIIRRAIDGGVNYIDTAYLYPGSEAVVGKALRDGYRERVMLATKQPTRILESGGLQRGFFEEQLKLLQTDHIDVYFLHNLGIKSWDKVQREGGWAFLQTLKDEKLISYAAASLHGTHEHFRVVADAYPWDLMMLQYNYYDRFNQAGQEGARYVAQKGIPLVTMESTRGGMLAANVPERVRAAFSWEPEMPDYERALAWLIDQPEVTVILSGISSMEQLEQNLAVFDKYDVGCLTEPQLADYETARQRWNELVKVPCTGCNYCVPCPKGVDIPGVFDLYNVLARAPQDRAQTWLYQQQFMDGRTDAGRCIGCGVCEGKCPQGIKIREKLVETHRELGDSTLG